MKAAIARSYGPPEVVELADVPPPVLRPGNVLLRVTAAAVTTGDARIRAASAPAGLSFGLRLAFGLRRPRQPVLGMFLAGRIVADSARFRAGDRVMGNTGMALGAHAGLAALPEDRFFAIPPGLDDAEAAALMFGGLTAADFLIDKAALAKGERILINGASGEVGVAAVQIARHLGADVTAICSAANHGFIRSLGADQALDYRRGVPTGQWDVVMDIAGTLPFASARSLMTPGGRLLPVTATLGQMLGAMLRPKRGTLRVASATTSDGSEALRRLLQLYAQGALGPVIGARLPLAQIVEAHRIASSGHKRGSCVVEMDQTAVAIAAK